MCPRLTVVIYLIWVVGKSMRSNRLAVCDNGIVLPWHPFNTHSLMYRQLGYQMRLGVILRWLRV